MESNPKPQTPQNPFVVALLIIVAGVVGLACLSRLELSPGARRTNAATESVRRCNADPDLCPSPASN
jgi:hypothetical protein